MTYVHQRRAIVALERESLALELETIRAETIFQSVNKWKVYSNPNRGQG